MQEDKDMVEGDKEYEKEHQEMDGKRKVLQ